MKQIILVFALSLFLAACFHNKPSGGQTTSASQTSQQQIASEGQSPVSFSNPKKSAHYVSNSPEHGSTLTVPPGEVVINFNFDLVAKSTISIKSDSKEYGTGQVVIDSNRKTMRLNINPAAPDGLYTVSYTACWPDGTCHEGNFQFAIKRS